jgi:hydrogenase expression/formation protein HypC
MCLGIPGEILIVRDKGRSESRVAKVDFQGSQVEVSLSLVPDAGPGDWVLVHAGYALTRLDAAEAAETWRWLDQAEAATEVGRAQAQPQLRAQPHVHADAQAHPQAQSQVQPQPQTQSWTQTPPFISPSPGGARP